MVTEQRKAKREPSATTIRELKAVAATRCGLLGVVVRAVWSVKILVAAGEDTASTAEARALEKVVQMSEFWALLEMRH